MHSLPKVSQHGTSKHFDLFRSKLQNQTDINWNKSDLKKRIEQKYKLTNEEIDFIESMIKPMN